MESKRRSARSRVRSNPHLRSNRQLPPTLRPVSVQAAAKEAKLVAAPAELNTDADEDQVPFQLNLRCRLAALAR